jgi:carbamoyltransferase
MDVTLGISGARRNAAAAVSVGHALVAACEQERLVRVRGVGLTPGSLPEEAVDAVLALAGRSRSHVTRYASAEPGVAPPASAGSARLDHHQGHAATAFLTSPFPAAAVLVCDRHSRPATTVWTGDGWTLSRPGMEVRGPGLAELYSRAAAALGLGEHEFEAVARLGDGPCTKRLHDAVTYHDGAIEVTPRYEAVLSEWGASAGTSVTRRAEMASSIQRRLGELLLRIAADVRRHTGLPALSLGGGLFYNTYFTTLLAGAGLFDDVFVPDNPGNAGLAVGAALASMDHPLARSRCPVPSFLGPGYEDAAIKAALDNCKLSYDYLSESAVIDQAVDALARGELVGWFDGRMEWGHRALGNRSILTSPVAPYALENLNVFLKRRPPWRTYGLSVCEDDLCATFEGPARSRAMEYEYRARDPERLRAVLPVGARPVRVHTVGPAQPRFGRLLKAFGARCGVPALVNTSFNGLHEPIVCSPLDAVRVFYGTGLDALVIGNFVLRK